MKETNFKKKDLLILFFILLIAVVLRLYKINSPLADFHSWRQVDTAAVSRNFIKNGVDLFHPVYDDLSNVQSGMDNPSGYRMVEFPIYNAIVAVLYRTFPFFTIEIWGRLTTIIFSLIVISIIYYLLLKEGARTAAIFGSFTYAVFPFFVFFSRVVLPETTALAFAMISIFLFYLNTSNNKRSKTASIIIFVFSSIFFAGALLIKPTTIFYLLPIITLFYRKYKFNLIKKFDFYLYFFITFIPLIYWRTYIKNFPEGIPVSDWLFTSVNTAQGLKNIMFRPSFFRWIFFERINNLILGGYLTFFFLLGIISKHKKKLILSFLIASLTYILVFQGGNIQHEYYQTLILPVLAMMIGLGIEFIFENKKNLISLFFVSLFIFFTFAFSFYFSYFRVTDYYQYSQELVQEANIISSLTDKNDLIVTDRTGDTTLLYLANRRGAPSIFKDPIDLKKLGYKYLITSSEGQINSMRSEFKIIFENEKFTLFKL
ncbi:MAG: glycosyltransferase family 39 protein [Patescibacteria group bacterium]|jgi:4-amino-4-deoxy-L-arabinose transferase-like glycosyltransferase